MSWIHPEQFRRCVVRYRGHYKVLSFSCWEQFLAMAFAQVTHRESLADLEVCLRSRPDQLYHMGFRSGVAHTPANRRESPPTRNQFSRPSFPLLKLLVLFGLDSGAVLARVTGTTPTGGWSPSSPGPGS